MRSSEECPCCPFPIQCLWAVLKMTKKLQKVVHITRLLYSAAFSEKCKLSSVLVLELILHIQKLHKDVWCQWLVSGMSQTNYFESVHDFWEIFCQPRLKAIHTKNAAHIAVLSFSTKCLSSSKLVDSDWLSMFVLFKSWGGKQFWNWFQWYVSDKDVVWTPYSQLERILTLCSCHWCK